MNVRVLIVACISIMAAMLGLGILTPILPIYAQDLGASGTMLGIIYASFAITLAIFNPIVGRLSDRFGYKLFITFGLGISVPIVLLFVLATNPYHLIFIRLLEGIFCAMIQTSTVAYVGSVAPSGKEGSYMGIYNTFFLMGLGAGPLLGGIFTDLYDIKMPFYIMAIFLGIAFFVVLLLMPRKNDEKESYIKKIKEHEKQPIKLALNSRLMQAMLIFGFILALGQGGLMAFLPLLTWREQLSATQIGILTSTIMVCAGLLQTPSGYLANKYNKVFLVISGVLLFGVGLAFVPMCHSFLWFFIFSFCGGVAIALCNPAANAIMVRGFKEFGIGFAFGLYNLAMGIGMIIGPVFSGFIIDISGLDNMFYVSSVMYILAAIMIYRNTKGMINL